MRRPLLKLLRARPVVHAARAVHRTSEGAWEGVRSLASDRPFVAGIVVGVTLTLFALSAFSIFRGAVRRVTMAAQRSGRTHSSMGGLPSTVAALVSAVLTSRRRVNTAVDEAIVDAVHKGTEQLMSAVAQDMGSTGKRRRRTGRRA
jgi:hypothetical protein